jgi:cell shape-determining protein MreC
MRHISIEPPAFFHRGPAPIARLAFFGLISIALLFIDTRYHYLEGIRRAAAVVLYPLQRAAQLPGEALTGVADYFGSLHSLRSSASSSSVPLQHRATRLPSRKTHGCAR